MNKKNNVQKKHKSKLSLCIQTKRISIKNNNYKEIMNGLISSMSEIEQIINLDNLDVMNFIYSNKKTIEFILYENEKIIFIHSKLLNKKLSNYFYLALLIRDNINIVNYSFKFDLIKEINDYKIDNSKDSLRKILISKIGIELINNYRECENYDENEEQHLINIQLDYEKDIKNNIDLFKNMKLNYNENEIKVKKIDEIYIDIIISLIKNNKFEDEQYIIKIFKQLDLININLTNLMFTELISFLDSDNENIINYAINDQKDLINTIKVNFLYFLLKYILKEPVYIYQSKFLIKTRINIIKIIKNFDISFKSIDAKNIEKIEYILKFITDSEYYLNLYKSNITQTITEKETDCNEYKKESIEKIEELNKEDIKNFIEKILTNSSFILKNNEKGEIICNILNDDQNNKKINIIKKYNKILGEEKFNILMKNFKKLLEFLHFIKEKIKKEFKFRYNLIIKINFNLIDINASNKIFNIKCNYYFYPLNKKEIFSFKDENILVSGINGSLQGVYFLLYEINYDDYKKIIYKKNIDTCKLIKEKDNLEKKSKENKNKEKKYSIYDIGKSSGASEYEIIKLEKVMGEHSNSCEIIKELSNGYYLSIGKCKYVYIYNEKFEKIMEIYSKIYPNNIIERDINNNNNNLELIAYSEEKIILITLNLNIRNYKSVSFKISASNIIEINDKDYIINNKKGGFLIKNLFSSSKNIIQRTLKYYYKVGLKIDEQNAIFTSNEIIHNGKNRLIIYEIKTNEINYELEGYSFSLSQNSLYLIENNNVNKDKILICACKKYDYNQNYFNNNGILLLNINYIYDDIFYNTENFEAYCFCQIKLVCNEDEHKKEYKTNYFLVGGFDKIKMLGAIKLYKIKYEDKGKDTRIEFIQDLIFENNKNKDFYGFNGAVTCIIQTKDKGNFLISCTNGKVYLFTPPNINYFLFYDEQNKEDFDYDEIPFYDEKIQNEVNDIKNKNIKYNNKIMFNTLLDIFKKEILFDLEFFGS